MNYKKNKKNNKGFTLIELLIVIGIIAILAAAVIIAINPGRQFQQARNSSRWSHMNSIANAVYSYAVDSQGIFPGCVSVDAADVSDCTTDLVGGGYISAIPTDPSPPSYYTIEKDGEYRITIKSTAQEAIDETVQVTQ